MAKIIKKEDIVRGLGLFGKIVPVVEGARTLGTRYVESALEEIDDNASLEQINDIISKAELVPEEERREDLLARAYIKKARILLENYDSPDEAESCMDEFDCYPNDECHMLGDELYGDINCANEAPNYARRQYISAMGFASGKDYRRLRQKYDDITDELYEDNWNDFTKNVDYIERQFIFIVRDADHIAGCFDPDNIINYVFEQGRYPKDIKFVTDVPRADTLYVAHPKIKNLYLPLEKSEEDMFSSKVNELTRLVAALGATSITIKTLKGINVSTAEMIGMNVEGYVDTLEYGQFGLGYGMENDQKSVSELRDKGSRSHSFIPEYYPYVPEDLIWFDTDESWKTMVKLRTEGNQTRYTLRVSSIETSFLSDSNKQKVKAAYSYMLNNVNATFADEDEDEFETMEETEWQIDIEFADKNTLTKRHLSSKPWENDLLFNVEDLFTITGRGVAVTGHITSGTIKKNDTVIIVNQDGRRIKSLVKEIEMFRKFLDQAEAGDNCGLLLSGIRKSDVIKGAEIVKFTEHPELLEDNVTDRKNCLTKSEQDFLKKVMESYIASGTITTSRRRFLDAYAKNLGITPKRATELEEGVFTDEEKQYMDQVRMVIIDGQIDPTERMNLNDWKEMLKISDTKALEIESILLK